MFSPFAEEFVAEIHTKNFDPEGGWVGIGFSNGGNLSDGSGDFCIAWKSQLQAYAKTKRQFQLSDVYVKNGTTQIDIDPQQDCKDFQFTLENGTLKWSFRRKFVTCDDKHDYALEVCIFYVFFQVAYIINCILGANAGVITLS